MQLTYLDIQGLQSFVNGHSVIGIKRLGELNEEPFQSPSGIYGCGSYSFCQVVWSLGSIGIYAVAVDLPGSGFSDKSALEEDER
uniref:Uncharacterized protein n=1 Tax=Nelumbo nucifera TaxID=4432 RepID=A0A822YYW9_NELNU|nr:TPA_asm: hypothetical protein HUJ06_008513 [Nelumbo nucifera]